MDFLIAAGIVVAVFAVIALVFWRVDEIDKGKLEQEDVG